MSLEPSWPGRVRFTTFDHFRNSGLPENRKNDPENLFLSWNSSLKSESTTVLSHGLASFEPKSGAPNLAQTSPDYPFTAQGWFHPPPCGSKGVESKILPGKQFFLIFLRNHWFPMVPILFLDHFSGSRDGPWIEWVGEKNHFDFRLKWPKLQGLAFRCLWCKIDPLLYRLHRYKHP